MPRDFNGTSDYIQTADPGTSIDVGFGSLAAFVYFDSFAATQQVFCLASSSTGRMQLRVNTSGNPVFRIGTTDITDAGVTLTASKWYVLAYGKTTGTTTPRGHIYDVAAGTWTHSDFDATSANSTALATNFKFGTAANAASPWLNGRLAGAAFFDYALSDAQAENLANSWQHWLDLIPICMWLFDQETTGQAVIDLTGRGANQSVLTGTSIGTESVPMSYGGGMFDIQVLAAAAGGTKGRLVGGRLTRGGILRGGVL